MEFNITFLIIVVIFVCPTKISIAQNIDKKIYYRELDSLWSYNTYLQKISPDNNWIVYNEIYHNKESQTTLKNVNDYFSFALKDCKVAEFSKNSQWFSGISSDRKLIIIDLLRSKKKVYAEIRPQEIRFSQSGDFLAIFKEYENNKKSLNIINLRTQEIIDIPGVIEFEWHHIENRLLITRELQEYNLIEQYDLKTNKIEKIIKSENGDFEHLHWGLSGKAIFIKSENTDKSIHFLDSKGEIKIMNNKFLDSLFKGYKINPNPLHLSSNGEKVLFFREKINDTEDSMPQVEIWNTEEPWIQPRMKFYKKNKLARLLTAWYPETNELVAVETELHPTSAMDIEHEFALVYNEIDYEPSYKLSPYADIYSKNLKTGKTSLIAKKQYTEGKFITISPEGKYIAYFKNRNWWVYDIKNDNTINLTINIPTCFKNCENDDYPHLFYPYGNPGWLNDDSYILLYDQYDIWKISPDGKEKKRLTEGREKKLTYRLIKNPKKIITNHNYASTAYNDEKGLVMEITNQDSLLTGYAFSQRNDSIKTLLLENQKLDNLVITENSSYIFYRKQRYDKPIALFKTDLLTTKEILLHQSNEKLLEYDLGKVEILNYLGINQKPLKGALLYPANFNPSKKYPTIIQIYEKESHQILNFSPPSDYGLEPINVLKYITNGYFVFLPDFNYEQKNPGISALNCLTSSVDKIIENPSIDKNKIGLIGHSFGGYETVFAVTHSNRFAVAVAGAPVTDLVDFYHSIFWELNMNQLWRLESQQFRMGTSFYNDKESYYKNSAFHEIEKINTPLLLWSGKRDSNINWHQSVKLFMGLKRLNKKSKMLLFSDEPHNLLKLENQKILSKEIFEWMERHLK